MWQKEAQDKFGVETIESDVMKAALNDWVNIYQGKPDWITKKTAILRVTIFKEAVQRNRKAYYPYVKNHC